MPSAETDYPWRFAGPPWRNSGPPRGKRPLWLPVVICGLVQIVSVAIAVHSERPALIVAGVVAFGASLLLLVSRRAPGPIVAVIAALCTPGIALVNGPPLAAAPVVVAVVIAVHSGARVWVWSSLGGIALIGGIGGYLLLSNPFVSVRVLIVVIALCLVVALSEAARARRARYRAVSRDVAARRQSAAEAERMRIARELHDVLAHSLSQISVQAGVGLHLFEAEPQRAKDALASIKETSSRALNEVRGVLGVLRDDAEQPARAPDPDLSNLPELVRTAREAGVQVTVVNELDGTIPSAVQFAIYRIVQESLTNVLRHSGARVATVRLSQTESAWIVEVTDPGPKTAGTSSGSGRGLVGMRERAQLFGGHVTTESVGGGFRVVAELQRPTSNASERP